MTRTPRLLPLLLLLALAPTACASAPTRETSLPDPMTEQAFKDYWFAGKAELARYALEQERYGEIRKGDAVLIFVTEDFLPDKQVKADSSDRARTGALPVLKLNLTKKFITGIYPYSIMTSVFTPLELPRHARTLKTSTSVQEWCGQVWLQLNLRGDAYRFTGHSYFESEADQALDLPAVALEDGVWTRIRLAPRTLPTGELEMIPGGEFIRLRHHQPAVESARATLSFADGVGSYTIDYPALGRTLAIRFEQGFPHGILGWEERIAGKPTTRAERTNVLRTDYWTKHGTGDVPLRRELGLD